MVGDSMGEFYVYVYIDPRNYEEFYYGKGSGSRKDFHLSDESDSAKTRRIKDIRAVGLEPTVRVIAHDLSEDQAFLIEKTLLWKLGKNLTNEAGGSFGKNFRPHNMMHVELSGFDFKTGIYYYNVGDGNTRKWTDYKTYNFISAGQGSKWRDSICNFQEGDVVAAYLNRHGYVGIGSIMQRARPLREIMIKNKFLIDLVHPGMRANVESDEKCEYVALVTWHAAVDGENAKWKSGLFSTRGHVRASLDRQQKTIEFLESEFGIDMRALAR